MNQLFSFKELGEEHCYILSLNSKCRMLGVFLLSKGSINQSFVGSREIYIRALLCGASGIILIHNHPSKDPTPSSEDVLCTKKIEGAGNLIGIKLFDHIIIGGDNFYSFKEHEML